jgi:hypothetical protein
MVIQQKEDAKANHKEKNDRDTDEDYALPFLQFVWK